MPYCDLRYFSRALQKQTAAIVLLPDPSIAPPWSTLYLLHGLSDDHTMWSRRTSIERYVEGLPLVVVMPDGGRSFYCDAPEGAAHGQAIGEELPIFIESTFPVRKERRGRTIAGLSMGGYGAFRLALRYSDRFCAASSHSGALGFAHFTGRDEEFTREFKRVIGAQAIGGPNDLFSLVEKADKKQLPALRFDCGDGDHLLKANVAFHRHLDQLGIHHTYQQYPGGHTWDYWDRHIQDTLRFVGKEMAPEHL